MLSFVNGLVAAVIGISVAMVPRLSRADVPLGVSVPSSRTDDPVVRTALRRFELAMVCATVVAVVLAVVLSTHAVIIASLMPLALLLVAGVVWAVCRRPILQAKAEQAWYDDVPVALVASATPITVRPMWWGYLAAGIVLVVTAVVGVVRWDRLPSPYPTHFGANGHADSYADKSVVNVFGPLIIMAIVIAVVGVLQWITLRHGTRQYADGTADAGAGRARLLTHLTQWMLNITALLIALLVGAISLAVYLGASAATMSAVTLIAVAVVVIGVLASVLVALRMLRHQSSATGHGPEAPDDDAHWKGGLIYVNRDDPAAFVPKRTGVGFTVNFGSSAGKAISGSFVVIILLIMVVAIVAGSR